MILGERIYEVKRFLRSVGLQYTVANRLFYYFTKKSIKSTVLRILIIKFYNWMTGIQIGCKKSNRSLSVPLYNKKKSSIY